MREATTTDVEHEASEIDKVPEAADAAEDSAGDEREFESVVPQVRDAQSANWVMRHVVEAERRIAAAKAWLGREVRRAEREKEFFLRRFGARSRRGRERRWPSRRGDERASTCPAGASATGRGA